MKINEILINLTMIGQKARGMTRFSQEIILRCEELLEYQRLPVSYIFGKGNFLSWNNVVGRKCYYIPNIFSLDKGKVFGLARYFIPPSIFLTDKIIFNPFYQGCVYLNNQIITIHDLIALRYANHNIVQYCAYKLILPSLLKKVVHIIAVSQATKKLIKNIYGIPDSKITVIYNGVNREIFHPKARTIKSNSLLVVGAHLPHKNIHELLNHHHLWSSKYTLEIIAGDSPYVINLKGLVGRLGIQDRVKFSSGLDDLTLAERYRRAQALIFPSLEEGFGIPPLEAMSCGTPVIASDIPVHREVCGEAAIYISPGNQESWEKAFDVLTQDNLLGDHIDRGLERANHFSWVNSAVQLTELFKSMMQ